MTEAQIWEWLPEQVWECPKCRMEGADKGSRAQMWPVRVSGVDVIYRGIGRCDHCGKVLTEREWLSGICHQCWAREQAAKGRPVETLKLRKGLGDG